jgi:hypothetical protein
MRELVCRRAEEQFLLDDDAGASISVVALHRPDELSVAARTSREDARVPFLPS